MSSVGLSALSTGHPDYTTFMKYALLSLLLVGCQSTLPPPSFQVHTFTSTGTCWPITEEDMLTAAHVMGDMPIAWVDGIPTDEIIILPDIDGALLRFHGGHGHEPWAVDVAPLEPGEELLLSGWGDNNHWWTSGIAAGPDRASMSICPGDSGSPVRDKHGAVRAIVIGVGRKAQHHAWLIPMGDLMDAIRQVSKSLDPPEDR